MLVLGQWRACPALLSHSEPVKGALMTDEGLQFEDAEPEDGQDIPRPESEGFDAYRSVVRLLVGLALVGGDGVIGRLREWETAHPLGGTAQAEAEIDGDLARRARIGMAFETAEMVRQAALGSCRPLRVGGRCDVVCLRPITGSALFRPFWAPVRSMAIAAAEARFDRYYQDRPERGAAQPQDGRRGHRAAHRGYRQVCGG